MRAFDVLVIGGGYVAAELGYYFDAVGIDGFSPPRSVPGWEREDGD